ncbi:MAG: hypothetical protein SFH39_11465 [Candidatus Magnetobacterium sp. LHC-1]|uniref:Uncharacterized protein n=1 Tax=Candidatus Magnetobacterium casense TaxID=1455061 RepID=A0A088F8G8_9BACT|nr:hypothetical protein [Candidatus Magnetobacterium casensis]AIM41289.1 hypothetical protein Mcas_0694 [Candidatus Magnetobacterium casensis]MBF0337227.1 hypothetical protein [Nitrospirota bacterium]MBF0607843.1 hypothetical protein [Nitrospirota bacterium]
MEKQSVPLKEVRELANKFTPQEIETCITQQLQEGINECKMGGPTDHVINELSKAEFVRARMEAGLTLTDAMRELAKRIRNVQSGFTG